MQVGVGGVRSKTEKGRRPKEKEERKKERGIRTAISRKTTTLVIKQHK